MNRGTYAYYDGWRAAQNNRTLADNPYHYFWQTMEFHDWNEGWRDFRNEEQ